MTQPVSSKQGLSGLLVVDKPLGWTSMDVVRLVRRRAGGTKTGHAGTLDPLATGVLVCCLGRMTKAVPHLMGLTKVYEATVDLSAFTDTDDREGRRIEVSVETAPDEVALRQAVEFFVGSIEQRPPAYSAVHVGGRRAYERARRGETMDLPPRVVTVNAIEFLEYVWPIARLRITCGKGTYIRSIARDLGRRLGTGGHLHALRRTAVGSYDLSLAVDVEEMKQKMITQSDLHAPPEDA